MWTPAIVDSPSYRNFILLAREIGRENFNSPNPKSLEEVLKHNQDAKLAYTELLDNGSLEYISGTRTNPGMRLIFSFQLRQSCGLSSRRLPVLLEWHKSKVQIKIHALNLDVDE